MVSAEFTYWRSKILVATLVATHLGALLIWIICPMYMPIKLLGASILSFSIYRVFRIYLNPICQSDANRLIHSTNNRWHIQNSGQNKVELVNLVGWTTHPWLMILRFVDSSSKTTSIVLLPDSADSETLRHLRVRLRYSKSILTTD